jgi:uncharacterized protein YkwD
MPGHGSFIPDPPAVVKPLGDIFSAHLGLPWDGPRQHPYYASVAGLTFGGVLADVGSVDRCLPLLLALALALLMALPATAGATSRGTVHVRHQTIHRPAHKKAKHPRSRHKHRARKHKRTVRNKHKHKRTVRHTHKRPVRHSRPATASRDCPGANLTPKPANIEIVVAATLCLVNDERARFGEPALILDARLSSAATGHSRDMDALNYFEHVSPGGQTLLMRVQASGFIPNGRVGYTLGENIAWGTLWLGTPRAIVKAWMESAGHRANILNRSYRYTGIGIGSDLPRSMSSGQAGGMYTQDFGAISG